MIRQKKIPGQSWPYVPSTGTQIDYWQLDRYNQPELLEAEGKDKKRIKKTKTLNMSEQIIKRII